MRLESFDPGGSQPEQQLRDVCALMGSIDQQHDCALPRTDELTELGRETASHESRVEPGSGVPDDAGMMTVTAPVYHREHIGYLVLPKRCRHAVTN